MYPKHAYNRIQGDAPDNDWFVERGGMITAVYNRHTGKLVGAYTSQIRAAEKFGIDKGILNNILRGKQKNHTSYSFKTFSKDELKKPDDDPEISTQDPLKRIPRQLETLETEDSDRILQLEPTTRKVIKIWPNIKMAAKAAGFAQATHFANMLRSTNPRYFDRVMNGHIWKFEDSNKNPTQEQFALANLINKD